MAEFATFGAFPSALQPSPPEQQPLDESLTQPWFILFAFTLFAAVLPSSVQTGAVNKAATLSFLSQRSVPQQWADKIAALDKAHDVTNGRSSRYNSVL